LVRDPTRGPPRRRRQPEGRGVAGPGTHHRAGSPAGTRARGRRRITGARHPQRHLGE
jgi:hypothetical protein